MPDLDIARVYRPNRAQRRAHADGAKFILALGGWRSSKSTWARWEMVLWGLEAAERWRPGMKRPTYAVFRKTEPMLEKTIQKDWMTMPAELIRSKRISRGRAWLELPGGAQVLFLHLDDPKKLGSLELDGWHMEEAEEFTRADFTFLIGRLSGQLGPRRGLITCNPPTKTHWLFDEFAESDDPNRTVHHFSTYDNAENLPADYLGSLEKLDEPTRRRYVYGEWGFVPKGTPVYKNFRESTHAFRPLRPAVGVDNILLRGWDFGFHRPFVAWAQAFPRHAHVNILRELPGRNIDIRTFCQAVKMQTGVHFPHFRPNQIEDYCDPAGDQVHDVGTSSVKELRAQGIVPFFRRMGLMKSIRAVQYLISTIHMDRPLLMVDPSCRTIIDGFVGGYALDQDSGEPEKDGEYDHALDAVRMALAPLVLDLDIEPRASTAAPAGPRIAI